MLEFLVPSSSSSIHSASNSSHHIQYLSATSQPFFLTTLSSSHKKFLIHTISKTPIFIRSQVSISSSRSEIRLDQMLSEKASRISMTNNNNRYDGYASNINMVDAPMKFHLGKRKEKSLAPEAAESVFSNGDSARIGGNLTPIRNKRTKLLKMNPVESLLPTSHAVICNTKTGIRRDGILQVRKFDVESEEYGIKERIELGGSLDMLVDAIQMVEDRNPQKLQTVEAHKKDLGFFLAENLVQGNDSVGMPGSGNHQCCENHAHELGLDIKSFEEQYPSKTGGVDGEEVMPRTRSSRGWLPTLPSKYSDSVLQPWKKVTRKAPKF